MTTLRIACARIGAVALVSAATGVARADEGLWTFDKVPVAAIRSADGVSLDQAWLDAAQAAAVRLTSGCSGGIVSSEGLVATNAHCIADCARALSGEGGDDAEDGFLTDAREDERRCAGVQAEVLLTIVDVTDQVRAAVAEKSGRDFVQAREGALALAELAACGQDRTLRCQAIRFFGGAEYKVYKYRRYDDVRLVFAPERASAAFGGGPDNYNFPRHALDAAFLRLYVDGRPAGTPDFFRLRNSPPVEGEPTFVVGNPGTTERQLTMAQLETQRDLVLPMQLLQRAELRGRLLQLRQAGGEHARAATPDLAWVENSYKAGLGKWAALEDKAFHGRQARGRGRPARQGGRRSDAGGPDRRGLAAGRRRAGSGDRALSGLSDARERGGGRLGALLPRSPAGPGGPGADQARRGAAARIRR